MSHDLPPVSSTTDAFLSVLAQRQDVTNALLAQILDRLPPRPSVVDVGTVELREPQAKPEPSPGPVQQAAPVATARKRATRKGA